MREHDDVVGDRNDCPQDDSDILDHGEDVAGCQAGAPLHADAAQQHYQQRHDIQHKDGRRVDDSHADIGADQVVGHRAGGPGHFFMGLVLPVEGTDHADAAQPFPHQVVLPVAEFVGDFPAVLDLFAQEQAGADHQRHGAEDNQRKLEILPHAEDDAAQERQRDDQDAAAERGDHPVQGVHVMGRARHDVGRAEASDLFQRHGMDLPEEGGAQAPGISGNHVINNPVAAAHGQQAQHGNPQHPQGGGNDIAESISLRRAIDAPVQDVGHERGQQQVAGRGHCHQQRGQRDFAPIGLQVY